MTENVLVIKHKGGVPRAVVLNCEGRQIFFDLKEMGSKEIEDLFKDHG